jgi:hypothetical protein
MTTRPSTLAIAICAIAVCAPIARAKTKPTPLRAVTDAWSRCFPKGQGSQVPELPKVPDDDDLEVSRTSTGFHVTAFWGDRFEQEEQKILFQPKGCIALWVTTTRQAPALHEFVRIGWVNRSAPNNDEIRALVAAPAHEDAPAHAFARTWLTQACAGDSDQWTGPIVKPLAPAQPWHVGLPRKPQVTFWSVAKLNAIGAHVRLDELSHLDELLPPLTNPDIAGIRVRADARAQPKRTFSAAGVDVYESALDDRYGGHAIAILDRAANRHRWVTVTRGGVRGGSVQWLGAAGAHIVGITSNTCATQDESILVIDIPSGTAWAVRLPDASHDGDAPVRPSLSGSTLTLQAGKTSSQIDLAPLLAKIHE